MHSVFSLTLTFINSSILLLMADSFGESRGGSDTEFLAFLFIIVYVGAIAILFLFVVMMLDIRIVELLENTTRYVPIGIITGVVFFIALTAKQNIREGHGTGMTEITSSPEGMHIPRVGAMGLYETPFGGTSAGTYGPTVIPMTEHATHRTNTDKDLPGLGSLEGLNASGQVSTEGPISLIPEGSSSGVKNAIEALGSVLYTEYSAHFIISSIILLISMIGAIVLTLYHEKGVKRQNIYNQIASEGAERILRTGSIISKQVNLRLTQRGADIRLRR